jgi:hypothetical protein
MPAIAQNFIKLKCLSTLGSTDYLSIVLFYAVSN